MKKSNNLSTILLFIIIVIITILGIYIYKTYDNNQNINNRLKDLNNEITKLKKRIDNIELNDDIQEKRLLIEKSYSNYAWGIQYSGRAIFSDGTIYSWEFSSDESNLNNYNLNTAEGLKNYILENGNIIDKKVSEKDLKEIIGYIDSLEDIIDIKYPGADMGITVTSAWTNEGNKISLILDGDSVGENKTETAKKLISIIDKYL